MKKILKIVISISILILILVTSLLTSYNKIGRLKPQKICCNNNCFSIEIADTSESRQIWLMYRETLWNNEWMLFIYDKPWLYSFWMKNTLIPLAWIRMDENMKIVDIIQMDPCKAEECISYKPQSVAQYVLEINQWLISEKWLLRIWDSCELLYHNLDFQKKEIIKKIIWNWNVLKSRF